MTGKKEKDDNAVELLKDILITQLACANVAGSEIRKIVGCDMNRVSRILKHIGKENRHGGTAR